MTSVPFKFAIMLNRIQPYPWQIKVYEEIVKTGLASCELIILKEEEPLKSRSFIQKISDKNLLFEQFKKRKLNTGLYRPTHFPPFDTTDIIKIKPVRSGKANESFSKNDVDTIKAKGFDFILRFGFGILKGEILNAAKYGVWSFHHADEQEYRGGPAGYWEIYNGSKVQGVILQQLTERLDAGKIILKRKYSVSSSSYTHNVTKLLWHSADMPAQALRMIHAGTLDINRLEAVKTKAPVYHYPKNFSFLIFLLIVLKNKFWLKWMLLFKQENWIIGYRSKNDKTYKYISPNKDGEYFADPFFIIENDKPLIFAEHYSYQSKKGNIVLIEPGLNQVSTLIEKDTHLSYPFIFEENDITYIIPEESNSGSLNLYRWDKETKTAVFIQPILNIPAIDASIIKYNNKYYIFTGIKGELPNEKLFIYYSDKLTGPYLSHIGNPVKVSPKGSRMGGSFIVENEAVVRPSQYSVKYYGEKLVFQKITKLSPTEYDEEEYNELKPIKEYPFKCGLHTYNKKATFEVIDLKRMKSGFIAFKSRFTK